MLGACTFPEVDVGGTGGGSTSSAGTTIAATTQAAASTGSAAVGGGGSGGGCSSDVDEDGDIAAACGGTDCDDDDDGQTNELFGCGGTDCDDGDDRAFEGQTEYFTTPSLGLGLWDFDCSRSTEYQFAYEQNGLCVVDCRREWIETSDVLCGGMVNVHFCDGGLCGTETLEPRQQACH